MFLTDAFVQGVTTASFLWIGAIVLVWLGTKIGKH